MVREKKSGGFDGEELLDAVAEETEAPAMPAASDALSNPPLVTTGASSNSEVVTTSEVAPTTLSPPSDVTSTTVNTVLTTSLATLNVSTDETKVSIDLPEGIPLVDSVAEMRSQDLITEGSGTEPSNRPVAEGRPVARDSDMNPSQAIVAAPHRRCRRFTTGGAPASPRWPGELASARRLFLSTERSTQTPDGALDWDEDIQVERNTHSLVNLPLPQMQEATLCWDDVRFLTHLLTRSFRQTSNTRDEIRRMEIIAMFVLFLLLVHPGSLRSFRRVMRDMMRPSIAISTRLANPGSNHYGENLLGRPNFSEQQMLDLDTLRYGSYDPYLIRSLHTPLDRRPQESSLSQNSMLREQSLRDEEQAGLEDWRRENARANTRYGDPVDLRMYTLNREQRAANALRTRHGSDELDEFTLPRSEVSRRTFQSVLRRRPHMYGRSEWILYDNSDDVQLWESLLRTRDQGLGDTSSHNGYMDPSDNIVPLEEGEILVGRVRSTSYRISRQRPINFSSPLGLNRTGPNRVFRFPFPRMLGTRMPFSSMTFVGHGNLGIRLDGSSTDRRGTSTVGVNGLDASSPRERAVDGQGSLPRFWRLPFPAVSPNVVPMISTAPVNFSSEISNTRGGSLGRLQDAREGRRQVRERASLSFESLQWSRTRSCPALLSGFSDGAELEFRRYSQSEELYNSSSSSSQDGSSPVVYPTDGFDSFYDNQESIPVQDQVADHSMPVVLDDDLSEGHERRVTPDDSASDETDN